MIMIYRTLEVLHHNHFAALVKYHIHIEGSESDGEEAHAPDGGEDGTRGMSEDDPPRFHPRARALVVPPGLRCLLRAHRREKLKGPVEAWTEGGRDIEPGTSKDLLPLATVGTLGRGALALPAWGRAGGR